MNREIKFRAKILTGGNTSLWEYYTLNDLIISKAKERSFEVWNEFTGLKDKNGKEVFEGDIIQFSDYRYGDDGRDIKKFQNGEIYWLNNSFEIKWIIPIDWVAQEHKLCPALSIQCEVIGNIYETPELLKSP